MNNIVDSLIRFGRLPHVANRLGIHIPSNEVFLALAATFHAYHAIKHGSGLNPQSIDFVSNQRTFAHAFVAACESSALPCRPRLGAQDSGSWIESGTNAMSLA